MILVNVLLFIAIASGVVMLMIAGEDAALHRAVRLREASRAQAVAHGGELSAIAALRRDAVAGPSTDNAAEPWAAIAERDAPVPQGSFSLAVADAQSRFNVNQLMKGDSASVEVLRRIARILELPPEMVPRAIELIRLYGPVTDLHPLTLAGLDAATVARLSTYITALPFETLVNVNAAPEPLLAVLVNDADAARQLARTRERQGFLLPADFARERVAVPTTAGFTSDLFWVRTRVRIGETSQQLTSLLRRRRDADGRPVVEAVARWRGPLAPSQAPAL